MKSRAIVLLLLLFAVSAYSITISTTLVRNSDGTYDTAFPTGNKDPAAAVLAWDLLTLTSATGLITTNAYNDDLNDCCLSGTAEATATITVETCSGDNAGDNGWSITGGDPDQTLNNAGTDGDLPGSGAMRLNAAAQAKVAELDADLAEIETQLEDMRPGRGNAP